LRALIALLLAGCGAAPSPAPAPAAPPMPSPKALAARGLPGAGPYRVLILAGPGVSDLELFTVYYGLVATGWHVRIAGPTAEPPRGELGLPIPIDVTLAEAKPAAYDLLFVPDGAPKDAEALALVRAFAERHLATTTGGAAILSAAGVLEGRTLASDEAMVHIDGNLLSAARPGDLPLLIHALGAYAEDRLRQAQR
jgi:hypothetical protein